MHQSGRRMKEVYIGGVRGAESTDRSSFWIGEHSDDHKPKALFDKKNGGKGGGRNLGTAKPINRLSLIRNIPNILIMFSENLREDFLARGGKRGQLLCLAERGRCQGT